MLAAFAAMTGHHGVGSVDDLALFFGQQRLAVPKDDVEKAVTHLADRDILQRLGGGVLQFTSELFRLWLKQNHSLQETLTRYRFYHRSRARKPAAWQGRRVDWLGVLLWTLALGLVAAIVILWQSRNPSFFRMTPGIITQQTPASTVSPATAPSKITHLVYQGRPDAQSKWIIYYMRNDGTEIKALTNGASNDTNASLSPDGRKVVFVSDRDGNRQIYTMNSDGTNQVNLTHNASENWTPAWSPDGRYIAFSSFRDGNWELYYMNTDGSRPTRLTQNASADYSPAWSPDSKSLAFISDRDGNLEIYILTLDGMKERRYTNNPATDQSPAWSPDGKSLAWVSYRDGNMEIYVAGVDGSNLINITQDPVSDDLGPSWSPDGLRIAYYSNRDHGWDIYILDLATGKRLNLSSGTAIEQFPTWGQ
jgi:WD40 repeat protein